MPSLQMASDVQPNHVIVTFGLGIPEEVQGQILLWMEKKLRAMGVMAEVYKPVHPDDSKLRREMTKEQRNRL